ncbi:hypothetical protein GN958_ATG14807 [Phytophthora infestans]|uniref:Uncharacterized protein n=1 Tax=Phytophthora infestans TaxID=4787 RepID=A0A8S9U541_PHYIN|nr:hypothetical protein GN958_ATG14807 [Phytophthora infestans]
MRYRTSICAIQIQVRRNEKPEVDKVEKRRARKEGDQKVTDAWNDLDNHKPVGMSKPEDVTKYVYKSLTNGLSPDMAPHSD